MVQHVLNISRYPYDTSSSSSTISCVHILCASNLIFRYTSMHQTSNIGWSWNMVICYIYVTKMLACVYYNIVGREIVLSNKIKVHTIELAAVFMQIVFNYQLIAVVCCCCCCCYLIIAKRL